MNSTATDGCECQGARGGAEEALRDKDRQRQLNNNEMSTTFTIPGVSRPGDGEGLGLFREAALRDLRARSSPGTGGHDAPSEATDTVDNGKAKIQDLMIVMLINGAKVYVPWLTGI